MSKRKNKVAVLSNQSELLQEDYERGKSLNIKDVRTIKPLNNPQQEMTECFQQGLHLICDGSAGTGKTYYAMYLALLDLLSKETHSERIIIIRSAVASRDIGHLPGTQEEKMQAYETPYKDILANLTDRQTCYEKMKEQKKIVFMPTSFVRGLTWDNAIVLVDEVQNLNFHELNSVLTRVGDNSKVFILGDKIQTDLYKSSKDRCGMEKFLNVAKRMDDFQVINFEKEDIIRSGFVKAWIHALEEEGESV